eukprot:2592908-Pyramimonas_sp.AAC.1
MSASVCVRVCRQSVAAQSGCRPERPTSAALAEGIAICIQEGPRNPQEGPKSAQQGPDIAHGPETDVERSKRGGTSAAYR